MPTVLTTEIWHGIVRETYDDNTSKDWLDHQSGDWYPIIEVLTPMRFQDDLLGINKTTIDFNFNGDISTLRYTLDGGTPAVVPSNPLVFNNISVGNHTLVMYHVMNVTDSVTTKFRVNSKGAFGLKWVLQYNDVVTDELITCNILKKGHSGGSTEICGAGKAPVAIKWDDAGKDAMKPIRGSSCTVNLLPQSDEEFIDIINSDDGDYIIQILKGSDTDFEGIVQTTGMNIKYGFHPNQPFTIKASDGIGNLKDKRLKNRGGVNYTHDRISVIDFIERELHEVKLWNDAGIRVNNTIKPAGSTSNPNLSDAYFNLRNFFSKDGKSPTSYEVIEQLLEPLGLQLLKIGNDFYIRTVQYEQTETEFYKKSSFDSDLWIQETPTLLKTLDGINNSTDLELVEKNGSFGFTKGYKDIEVTFKYDLIPDLVDNVTDESSWDGDTLVNWRGSSVIKSKPFYRRPENLQPGESPSGQYPHIPETIDNSYVLNASNTHIKSKVYKVKKSEISGKQLLLSMDWAVEEETASTDNYVVYYEVICGPLSLKKTGAWQGHTIHSSTGTPSQSIAMFYSGPTEEISFQIYSDPIDFTLADLNATYPHVEDVEIMVRVWCLHQDQAVMSNYYKGFYIKKLTLQFIDGAEDADGDFESNMTDSKVWAEENTSRKGFLEKELKFGSSPDHDAVPTTIRNQYVDANGFPITSWVKEVEGVTVSTGDLLESLTKRIANQESAIRRVFTSSVKGDLSPINQISFESKQYLIIGLTKTHKNGVSKVKMIEATSTIA